MGNECCGPQRDEENVESRGAGHSSGKNEEEEEGYLTQAQKTCCPCCVKEEDNAENADNDAADESEAL